MLRNIVVASLSAVVIALAVAFQLTATTSHEVKDPSVSIARTEAPTPGATLPAGEDRPDDDDQAGKPGETKP